MRDRSVRGGIRPDGLAAGMAGGDRRLRTGDTNELYDGRSGDIYPSLG